MAKKVKRYIREERIKIEQLEETITLLQKDVDNLQAKLYNRELEDFKCPALSKLSQREKEIAHLVALGHGSDEMAKILYVTEGTIRGHLYTIYNKLGFNGSSARIKLARCVWVRERNGGSL